MSFPIVLLKNLPFDVTNEELYSLGSNFGDVIQIRKGTEQHIKGNCFVVYATLEASKAAIANLNGFSFKGRYLVALSYIVDPKLLEDAKGFVKGVSDQ